ncbi:MAG: hydrogen gas-evolving membrane-bound hydrogenase subunit E [Weeksellaceae bacterium]
MFFYFLYYLFELQSRGDLLLIHKWIPLLGIDLNFKLDGLSLLFSLLISGIGALIYFYASEYLKHSPYINRFFCYLGMFMGSMLGMVLSDNLITIFVFWELTSLSSFFLIGFNNEEEESRISANRAFLVTGLGGFFLLAGFMLLANVTGTYSIHEMLNSAAFIQEHNYFVLILIFIFLGAFTKSAQFPFHFWLPSAMAAPTPVSAYLHSATMVKAGIYILARFWPILHDGLYWNQMLMWVGGITMIYGAVHSIFRVDLKSILAYTTISALGIIVFLLGIGTELAVYAAVTFILIHALYKAALFLTAGIIQHAVHIRDIRKIAGLWKFMPVVAIAALVAALSGAGIPLTFGFIGKDLIYETTLQLPKWALLLTALALVTNVLVGAAGFLAGVKPFLGKLPEYEKPVEVPNFILWLPLVILSFLSILFGVLPGIADKNILKYAFQAVYQGETEIYLKLWHGFNQVFVLSLITIGFAILLFVFNRYYRDLLRNIEQLEFLSPQNIIETSALGVKRFAFFYTRLMHNGYLRNYVLVIIVFITCLVGYRFFTSIPFALEMKNISMFNFYELTLFLLMVTAIGFTLRTNSKLIAVASLGVIGFAMCLIFVLYGAPDLAMTQFSIDILTVVLFVLVLYKLPHFLTIKNKKVIGRDVLVSVCFGGLIMLIAMESLLFPADKTLSRFYAENAYVLAKGKNVVNVILVDFRGFDTMIESIVLTIAALGVYGLLKYKAVNEEAD